MICCKCSNDIVFHEEERDIPQTYKGLEFMVRAPVTVCSKCGCDQMMTLDQVNTLRWRLDDLLVSRIKYLQEEIQRWKQATKSHLMLCSNCGKPVLRRRVNEHTWCDSPKCKKIARLGHDKPVGFEGIPNHMSIHRADIQYHGKPQ